MVSVIIIRVNFIVCFVVFMLFLFLMDVVDLVENQNEVLNV